MLYSHIFTSSSYHVNHGMDTILIVARCKLQSWYKLYSYNWLTTSICADQVFQSSLEPHINCYLIGPCVTHGFCWLIRLENTVHVDLWYLVLSWSASS